MVIVTEAMGWSGCVESARIRALARYRSAVADRAGITAHQSAFRSQRAQQCNPSHRKRRDSVLVSYNPQMDDQNPTVILHAVPGDAGHGTG